MDADSVDGMGGGLSRRSSDLGQFLCGVFICVHWSGFKNLFRCLCGRSVLYALYEHCQVLIVLFHA